MTSRKRILGEERVRERERERREGERKRRYTYIGASRFWQQVLPGWEALSLCQQVWLASGGIRDAPRKDICYEEELWDV